MGRLTLVVRQNGSVTQRRSFAVSERVQLSRPSSADRAAAVLDIQVTRAGPVWIVGGHHLDEGDIITVPMDAFELTWEHTLADLRYLPATRHFDSRFLLVLVFISVSAAWLDAFQAWATKQRVQGRGLASHLQALEHHLLRLTSPRTETGSRIAAAVPRADPSLPPADAPIAAAVGPAHRPDDEQSRVRWYAWYRSAAPDDEEQRDAALAAHIHAPDNPVSRAVLGQTAYNADRFEDATRHFQVLVDHHPRDLDARLGLAQAQMRLGRHDEEILHLQRVLRDVPDEVNARAALAVALTRMHRLDEAAVHLDDLWAEAPHEAATLRAQAKVAAIAGRDDDALMWIDELMHGRSALSASAWLEVRRDIAIDPAFARLRKNVRLRSLVNRHLGAAGPRPMR